MTPRKNKAASDGPGMPAGDNPVDDHVRVLSIMQPYASRIIDGSKPIENRSIQTPYRGTIWIHASSLERKPSRRQMEDEAASPELVAPALAMWHDADKMPLGAIIGCVELVDIVPIDEFQILAETRLGAKKLEYQQYQRLNPGQREGFLEKWKHVHELVSAIPEETRALHASGPFCWLLRNPRRLRDPIPKKGMLNLWKLRTNELPAKLEFVH